MDIMTQTWTAHTYWNIHTADSQTFIFVCVFLWSVKRTFKFLKSTLKRKLPSFSPLGQLYKLFNSWAFKLNAVAVGCVCHIPKKDKDSKSSGLIYIQDKFQTLKDKTLRWFDKERQFCQCLILYFTKRTTVRRNLIRQYCLIQ